MGLLSRVRAAASSSSHGSWHGSSSRDSSLSSSASQSKASSGGAVPRKLPGAVSSSSHSTKKAPSTTTREEAMPNAVPARQLKMSEYRQQRYRRRWRLAHASADEIRVFVEEVRVEPKTVVEDDAHRGSSPLETLGLSPAGGHAAWALFCLAAYYATASFAAEYGPSPWSVFWAWAAVAIVSSRRERSSFLHSLSSRGGTHHHHRDDDHHHGTEAAASGGGSPMAARMGLSAPKWRLSGRVKASCYVDAPADEVFALMWGHDAPTRCFAGKNETEAEWSIDYEECRLVERIDAHTDVVEMVERTPLSAPFSLECAARKVLAWHARHCRLMRYWRADFSSSSSMGGTGSVAGTTQDDDDDGPNSHNNNGEASYTVVAQSVAMNASFHEHVRERHVCGVVEQRVAGNVVEIKPFRGGSVVHEACDLDAKLSPFSVFFCEAPPKWLRVSKTSVPAVAWASARLVGRLRGVRAACAACPANNNADAASRSDVASTVAESTMLAAAGLAIRRPSPTGVLHRSHAAANSDDLLYRGDDLSPRRHRGHGGHLSPPARHAVVPRADAGPPPSNKEGLNNNNNLSDDDDRSSRFLGRGAFPRRRAVPITTEDDPNNHAAAPLGEPHHHETNVWDEPPASEFRVRGPRYLEDGKKVRARDPAWRLVAIDCLRRDKGPVADVGRTYPKDAEPVFIVNMILPATDPHVSFCFYFVDSGKRKDPKLRARLDKFRQMSDKERNDHFKLIPFLAEGPWVAKHALGSKPAIIGRAIATRYFISSNVTEVDVDVASSSVALGVWRIMKGAAKSLVVDLAFLLESKTQEDLPETLIGTARIYNFDFARKDNPCFTDLRDDDLDDIAHLVGKDSSSGNNTNNGPTTTAATTDGSHPSNRAAPNFAEDDSHHHAPGARSEPAKQPPKLPPPHPGRVKQAAASHH